MRVEITKEECKWLIGLVIKEKVAVALAHEEEPNRLFALRRDNMTDLQTKLHTAFQRQVEREQRNRDGGAR